MPAPHPRWAWLVLCGLGLSGCAMLPNVTPSDVGWAKQRWPEASQASLEEGRRVFVESCSGCHALPMPDSHPTAEWPRLVAKMSQKADLTDREQTLVLRFLVTLSARPRSPDQSSR